MPEQLRQSPLRNAAVDLYIANFSGATSGTSFGFSQIPKDYTYLIEKAKNQLKGDFSKFSNDFVNYDEGIILCVNTANLLNKNEYKTSNGFSDSLKFTKVKLAAEFLKVNKS